MSNPSQLAVVWMTTPANGTPHAAALQTANPGLEVHVNLGVDGADETQRLVAWRNCDRHIRNWWIGNRKTCQADRILFLEWDVFCNAPLADLMPAPHPSVGLVGAKLATFIRDHRSWPPFSESARLPRAMWALAAGIIPLGVALMTRAALDALADPQHDELYTADVFCELRMATVIRAAGLEVRACTAWPHAGTTPLTPPAGAVGIYHPVKFPVS